MIEHEFLKFLFSPLSWFLIGWYSSRANYEKGNKAAFIKGLKVFGIILLIQLAIIGLLYILESSHT